MSDTTQKNNRARTYARNRVFSRRGYEKIYESDGVFLLKLVLVIFLGSLWLKFNTPLMNDMLYLHAFPIGLVLGLFFVSKFESSQANRKIWYAILLITAIVTYFLPAGIVI